MAPIFDINLFRRYIRKCNLPLRESRIVSQIPHIVPDCLGYFHGFSGYSIYIPGINRVTLHHHISGLLEVSLSAYYPMADTPRSSPIFMLTGIEGSPLLNQ